MKRIKDLKEELLSRNFKGTTCFLFLNGVTGTFKIKDVSFEELRSSSEEEYYAYAGENLVIDLGATGEFKVYYDNGIEKIDDELYKWGYRIKNINVDNNVTDQYTFEIGEIYTDEELINKVITD